MRRGVEDDFPLIAPRRRHFGRSSVDVQETHLNEVDVALKAGAGLSVTILAGVMLHLWLSGFGFGSDLLALRHVAAGAGCGAATAVGMAQAQYGQPGYWTRLDRNGNGLTCDSVDAA